MALKTLPLEMELVIYAGTNLRRQFRWLPDGVTGQDFTGWSAAMLIGPHRGTAVLELDSTGDGITLDDEGLITIDLTATQTQLLAYTAPNLIYQVDLTDTDSFVLRFLRGRLSVVTDLGAAT